MYYCDNYMVAVALCVVTMFCWGSWGNTQKLAGKTWRYELFYWDYVVGILLFSIVMGLTMGSCGDKTAWGFVANLKSSFGINWLWPFLSGVIFNASNILLVAAISVAGMSVAFPVGVGLALVGGTILNYAVKRQGSLAMIVLGLGLITVSILCNALAFKVKQNASGGAANTSGTKKGLILAALAGFMMMWFSPLVNRVVDLTFTNDAPQSGMLTPYTGFFFFAVGIFVSTFIFNTIAMRKPVQGEPIYDGAKRYFGGSFPIHLVGVLGGFIWGAGTLLSFVSAGKAGPAISYALGQGATLVSALWGILVWKEFAGAPKKSAVLNFVMFILFMAGLAALVVAGETKSEKTEKECVKIIFDTDMITDFDDVGALSCLHALADAGECEILATISCTRGNASVGAVEIINKYYGRENIPVGCAKEIGVVGAFPGAKKKLIHLRL
ncbi:MAG: multidrug DMT transporter permease [Kiritimatiellae bacterium]|nr:multidrug DMT transporter permease [Kiritimatiellia bacterium]